METNVDTTTALAPASETPATPVPPLPNQLYSKEFKIIGVTQIMVGTLSIMTWVYALTLAVSTRTSDVFVYISAGIWAGIFFLIAGILAVVSSVKPNNRNVGAGMTMAIFAAIFAMAMFGIEAAGAGIITNLASTPYYIPRFPTLPTPYTVYTPTSSCTPYYHPSYYKSSTYVPSCSSPYRSSRFISGVYIPSRYISCPSSYNLYSSYNQYNNRYYNYQLHQFHTTTSESLYGIRITLAVIHAFLALFALIEIIVAIIHSVYCCKFNMASIAVSMCIKIIILTCPSSRRPQPVVQYTTTYPQVNFTGVAQQMPVTSIGQPIGGAFQNTMYPVTSVPYQAPFYINQAAVLPNQQQVVTPIPTQSPPNYAMPQNPQPVATPIVTPMSPVAADISTSPTPQPLSPPDYAEASKTPDTDFPTA
ncbi:uncharacterized protein LOC113474905 [Ciona intestinalis]